MEGLRVILLAELLDLLRGDGVAADGIELLADVEVLEVKLFWHWVRYLLMTTSLCDALRVGLDRFPSGMTNGDSVWEKVKQIPFGNDKRLWAGDEQDGDVVAAAVCVGCVDEGLAGGLEGGAGGASGDSGEDFGDIGVGQLAGEAVGGEQVEVSGLGFVSGDVGLDGGLRADGPGDDVAD